MAEVLLDQYSDPLNVLRNALGLRNEEDTKAIAPDYSNTLIEVYANIVKYILTANPRPLRLLLAAGSANKSEQDLTWPSWIPDWSQRIALQPCIRDFEECEKFEAGRPCQNPPMQFFSAQGSEHLVLSKSVITSLEEFIDMQPSSFKRQWRIENTPSSKGD